MAANPRLDEADLVATDDGVDDYTGSGHVSGPWDTDELRALEERDA